MAITILQKETIDGLASIMFSTSRMNIDGLDKLICKITIVTDKLEPLPDQPPIISEILISEEEYHTDLRKQAAVTGHLITSHSTNPEWNPEGYTKEFSPTSKRVIPLQQNSQYIEGRRAGKEIIQNITRTAFKTIEGAIMQKQTLIDKFEQEFGYEPNTSPGVTDRNYIYNLGILHELKEHQKEN